MQFKVKNMTKYKKAKYPSHTEPEKLDLSRYSFPFSKCIKIGSVTALVASGFSFNCFADENNQNDNKEKPKVVELQNIAGGLAPPPYLSEREIMPAVKKVFVESGLNVKENIAYKDDKVSCELDLYDSVKRVGFEFLTHQDMENARNDKDKAFSAEEIKLLNEQSGKDAANVLTINAYDNKYAPRNRSVQAKKDALAKLEEAVRQYIKQLKEQGVL